METDELRRLIRSVPDFPRPGIVFRNATPLFADPAALGAAVDLLAERLAGEGPVDVVFGAEATYELEYGAAELHVHTDAIAPGARVVVHDDLIARARLAGPTHALIEF